MRRTGIKSIFTLVIMPLIMYGCTVVLFEAFCRSQNTAYGAYRAASACAVDKDVVQPVRLHVTFAESLSLERTWMRDRNHGDVPGKLI